MFQGRRRRLRPDAALPLEKASGSRPRGLHARTRYDNAGRMRLPGAFTAKADMIVRAARFGRPYAEACCASLIAVTELDVAKETEVSAAATFISGGAAADAG